MDNQPEWKRTKESTIVVNGQEWTIRGGTASYETVIALAAVAGRNRSVTYQGAAGLGASDGTLEPGQSILLGERTAFTVEGR